ncbi:MAG: Rrf2 family transcriptional regulator [Kiritimatiellia bacterium]
MEILRRETDYALRALHVLDRRCTRTDTLELAKDCKVPLPALRKIMQTLAKAGVVKTVRGKRGGYLLALPTRKISLARIVEAVQGPVYMNVCNRKGQPCPYSGKCPMKGSVCILQNRLNAFFEKTTLAEIYKQPKKGKGKS